MSRSFSCKLTQERYVKKNGKASVLLQIIINRKKRYIPTGVEVQPYLFNSNTGKIQSGGALSKNDAFDLNLVLQKEIAKANDLIIEARLRKEMITADSFKDLFLKAEILSKTNFTDFLNEEIERLKGSRQKSTIKTYEKTIRKLSQFRNDVSFGELTKSFIEDFDREMIRNGLSQNTRSLHHKNLGKFINDAIDRGINITSPYNKYKRVGIKGNRDFLTLKELRKLIKLYKKENLIPEQQNVLEYYLFSCYTGLRFSDIVAAHHSNIIDNIYTYIPVKNKEKVVKVPLSKRALKLIEYRKGKLFDTVTDQATNRSLKQIAEIACINKKVTFHTARHTFATTFLSLGGKVEVLQKIMGHSKLETTMVYVHILEEDMISQISNMDKL
ncbi:MAG: site-specific integrase [Vicingus serpentipes]|nr:site-specific integrase [Vicingus serpentipes]